jgi:hypothetical protein
MKHLTGYMVVNGRAIAVAAGSARADNRLLVAAMRHAVMHAAQSERRSYLARRAHPAGAVRWAARAGISLPAMVRS